MKQNKKGKSKFGSFIKDWLVGLFSNNRAIEGSKKHPWWSGLILAFIAIWLPIFPIIATYANMSGSSFMSTYTYGYNVLPELTVALNDKTSEFNKVGAKVDFKVNEDNKLLYYEDGQVKERISNTPLAQYVNEGGKANGEIRLEIYYHSGSNDEVVAFVNDLTARKLVINSTTPVTDTENEIAYTPSFLILYESGIFGAIYKDSSTEASGSTIASDWKHTKKDVFLLEERILLNKNEHDFTNPVEYQSYLNDVNKNWKSVFNEVYKTQKDFNVMFFMGLYLLIYVVLVALMGLLVFFLTRGKNNMFNYLKFIDCQKMVWWISFSPALIALIMGFLMSSMASMLFIILLGLRVMWMSMKQLKPQY